MAFTNKAWDDVMQKRNNEFVEKLKEFKTETSGENDISSTEDTKTADSEK